MKVTATDLLGLTATASAATATHPVVRTVGLLASDLRYVNAGDTATTVLTDSGLSVGAGERFNLVAVGDGSVALRVNATSRYVSVDSTVSHRLTTTATTVERPPTSSGSPTATARSACGRSA